MAVHHSHLPLSQFQTKSLTLKPFLRGLTKKSSKGRRRWSCKPTIRTTFLTQCRQMLWKGAKGALILPSNGRSTWKPLVPLGIHRVLLDPVVAVVVAQAAADVLLVGRNRRVAEAGVAVAVEARRQVGVDNPVILWSTLFPRRRARCTLRVSFMGIVHDWRKVDASSQGPITAALSAPSQGHPEVPLQSLSVRLGIGRLR